MLDLARLDQRQRLEELVHRPEAAREDDEALGCLHEHRLARVEVLERQRDVAVRIAGLLVRQLDVEARPTARPPSRAPRFAASITPGPPPVTTAKPASREAASDRVRRLVDGRSLAHARGAEDGDCRPVDRVDGVEAGEELGRDQRDVGVGGRLAPEDTAVETVIVSRRIAHSRFCGTCAAIIPSTSANAVATEIPATTQPERRAAAGSARRRPAQDAPRVHQVAAVEKPDGDQVEEVEEEAHVGEREQEVASPAPHRPRARTAAPAPPATGPASETRALRHGSNGTFLSAT